MVGITHVILFILAVCNCGRTATTGDAAECELDEDCDDSDPCTIDRCVPEQRSCFHYLGCARSISSGTAHRCVLTPGGSVKCLGNNQQGQLGNGDSRSSVFPVDVVGLSSDVKAIDMGHFHSCAIMESGGAKCWGDEDALGAGELEAHQGWTPVDVVGLSSGVSNISAGSGFTCAVTESGGAMCWGKNITGSLGNGTFDRSKVPVDVIGLSSGVASIYAGGGHTCAVLTSGDVKCWGGDGYGQIGDGVAGNFGRETPTDVMGLSSDVKAVSLGYYHTCCLTESGGVKCWGRNNYGQLGDGMTRDQYVPQDVVGLSSGVSSIAAGWDHTCAVMTSGSVKCWGCNHRGQLGNGTTEDSCVPVDVAGLPLPVVSLSAGGSNTWAVLDSGEVMSWGVVYGSYPIDDIPQEYHTPVNVMAYQ